MKCPNCETEFDGNICPNCNTSIIAESEALNASGNTINDDASFMENDLKEENKPKIKFYQRKAFKITRIVLECACVLYLFVTLLAFQDTINQEEKNLAKYNEASDKYESLSQEYNNSKEK